MDMSPRWTEDDNDLELVYNFTDVRAAVDVITSGLAIENMTLTENKKGKKEQTGDNNIYNDTDT
jgi:hypothetical protein